MEILYDFLIALTDSFSSDGPKGTAENADTAPELTMFIGNESEAVLLTKGDQGLLFCTYSTIFVSNRRLEIDTIIWLPLTITQYFVVKKRFHL